MLMQNDMRSFSSIYIFYLIEITFPRNQTKEINKYINKNIVKIALTRKNQTVNHLAQQDRKYLYYGKSIMLFENEHLVNLLLSMMKHLLTYTAMGLSLQILLMKNTSTTF